MEQVLPYATDVKRVDEHGACHHEEGQHDEVAEILVKTNGIFKQLAAVWEQREE